MNLSLFPLTMTAQSIHRQRIQEHQDELKDALALGLEQRPATIGFHASAGAIDLLELYLHKTDRIPIGQQIKHDWFKRPVAGQKIKPLAERHLPAEFPHKEEIFELFYTLEEKRNKLIYGKSQPAEIRQVWEAFERVKSLLLPLLAEAGEHLEDSNS